MPRDGSFRLSWSRLFKSAFRDGEDVLSVQKLRKRVLKAALAAAEEAGAETPDMCVHTGRASADARPLTRRGCPPCCVPSLRSEDLKRTFVTKLTFSERLRVDGDTVRWVPKRSRQPAAAAVAAAPVVAGGKSTPPAGAAGTEGHRRSQVEWTSAREPQRWEIGRAHV